MLRRIQGLFQELWQRSPSCYSGHWWCDPTTQSWQENEDHPGGPPCNEMLRVNYTRTTRVCAKCGLGDSMLVSVYVSPGRRST